MSDDRSFSGRSRAARSRERVLSVAAQLFYAHGVRAIGMDQIVAQSGVAKTTIYRHFPTKDRLVEAFLEKEDGEFWGQWDDALDAETDPARCLDALCRWVGERVVRPRYRGCPQVNVGAEFSDDGHPAKVIARRHKAEMRQRLVAMCSAAGSSSPEDAGAQIALLFDGAFVSGSQLADLDLGALLTQAARRLGWHRD